MATNKDISSEARHTLLVADEIVYESWNHWPVNWSAVLVGALAAVTMALIFGLIAVALGAHAVGPDARVVDLRKLEFAGVAFAIFGAFLSFVIGAWIAGKIAGVLHAEPAMVTGGIVWLTAIPILALFAAANVGADGWYHGVIGGPASIAVPYDRPEYLSATASDADRTANEAAWSDYRRKVAQWQADTPRAVRNSAVCAITSLLLGLVGSIVGGWAASGEPMHLGYRRPRSRGLARATT